MDINNMKELIEDQKVINKLHRRIAESSWTYQKAINKLHRIAELKDNWNDNGASAFSKILLIRATNILNWGWRGDCIPVPFPRADDAIQFEWQINNYYIQLDIYEDKYGLFVIEYDDDENDTILINVHLTIGCDLLCSFVDRICINAFNRTLGED